MARRDRRRGCRRGSDWSPGPASPLPTRLAWGRHADAGGGGSGSTSELHFLWGSGRTEDPFSALRLRVSFLSGPPARGSREKGGRAAAPGVSFPGCRGLPAPATGTAPPGSAGPAPRCSPLLPMANPAGLPGGARRGWFCTLWNFAADFLLKVMEMGGWWSVAELMSS